VNPISLESWHLATVTQVRQLIFPLSSALGFLARTLSSAFGIFYVNYVNNSLAISVYLPSKSFNIGDHLMSQ
jgi:hypothetical protein